jgi:ketosteroid isomerase-like protein
MLNACTNGPSPAEMLTAAKVLDDKVVDAFSKRDVEALMDTHWNSPNLAILDEDEFFLGWETFKAPTASYLKQFKEVRFSYIESRNIVDGDLVLGQHKWHASSIGTDGALREETGLHSDVKALRNGKWVIIAETFVRLPPKPGSEDMKPAEALDPKGPEAYNKKDADAYMANYWVSPDLVVEDTGHILRGWDEWRSYIVPQMQSKAEGAKFEITEAHNTPMGSVVLGFGRWQFTYPGKGARVVEGIYTNVKALRNGKWVLVMDHYSPAAPSREAAPLPRK